jgi:hypothetical protein
LLRLTIANVVEWKKRVTYHGRVVTDSKERQPDVRTAVDADERDPFKRSHQGSEVLKKRVTFVSFC